MKRKRIVEYAVEGRGELGDAVIGEFKRKLRESKHPIANPTLERCWVTVKLDSSRRVPISGQTQFGTFPAVLGDGDDPVLLGIRNNAAMEYLQEARSEITKACESGAVSYTLTLHDYINPYGPRRCSVALHYRDAKGKKLSSSLM